MGPQPSSSPRIVFGPFEYEPASGDLRKHGTRIRLQGKPLLILSILLEQPNEVVSRDELQGRLWEGTTFIDFEQGLNAAVNKVRQSLGDSADQPRYIETVSGRGYRFIAPVARPSVKPVLEMTPLRAEPSRAKRRGSWLPWAAAIALAAVGAGAYSIGARRAPGEPLKPIKFVVTPPRGFFLEAGSSSQAFALSPDGSRVAFTAVDAGGAFTVFLRDFNSLDLKLIPDTKGAHTLFWPPDSRSLFVTVRGKLRRADLDSGAYQEICEAPSFMLSGAWLSPSRLLIGGKWATYEVSPSGGLSEAMKDATMWPQLLPDNRHILYVVWDHRAGRYRARVEKTGDRGSAKDLVESDSRVVYTASAVTPGSGYLLYIRAGGLIAQPFDLASLSLAGEPVPVVNHVYSFFGTGAADFSASAKGVIAYQGYSGRSQLVWVDRKGRQLATIGPANINVKSGRLSPDGRNLAAAIYDVEHGAQDLWLFDVNTGHGRRLAPDYALRDAPVWSPDSKSLVYLRGDGELSSPDVAIRGIGEHDTEDILPLAGYQMPTGWSPDGRFIAVASTGRTRFANEAQGDVSLVDLARNRKQIPLLNTAFHESNAAFSPDGKWIAFTSNESGQTELYVQAFRSSDAPAVTGERFRVSRSGAVALRWRRDGNELFYLAYDGRVYAVPVRLSSRPEFGAAAPLFAISPGALAAIHAVPGFDLPADGTRFLIPTVSSADSPPIVVVQNWEAGLRSTADSAIQPTK